MLGFDDLEIYVVNLIDYYIISGMWAAQIFYFLSFIPQIWTNYIGKSGTGISDLFMFGYLNGYATFLLYAFCRDLPFAYKFWPSLAATGVLIMILQRLYYDTSKAGRLIGFVYGLNLAAMLFVIPFALQDPYGIGSLCGWANVFFTSVSQLPQIVHIYKTKSVEGFSVMFVLLMGMAGFLEFTTSYLAGLPAQTIFSALRNIIAVLIYLVQFYLYKKSNTSHDTQKS